MDKELEIARMKLELLKVSAAKAELEFMVMQRQSEIKRVQENIQIQVNKEEELKQKIAQASV